MNRKRRVEDDLRSVWSEWSTPHDYGLWHNHVETTAGEQVLETVGITSPQEPAPGTHLEINDDLIPDVTPASASAPAEHKVEHKVEHKAEHKAEVEHKDKESPARGRSTTPKSAQPPVKKRRAYSVAKEVLLGRPNGNRAMLKKGLTSALGVAGSALGAMGSLAGHVYKHATKSRESSVERVIPVPDTGRDTLAPGVRMTASGYYYLGTKRISKHEAHLKKKGS